MMPMKPSVYIETTIPSYLTAWPSNNLIRAAHQEVTRQWWAKRDGYTIYASRLVIEECEAGDQEAAAAARVCRNAGYEPPIICTPEELNYV
jgi:hypothetical protein